MGDPDSNLARLEIALSNDDPVDVASRLAVALRDDGVPQDDILALFESSRARHQGDVDERRYDAVLDVMDFIAGWCSPDRRLFPPKTDAS